MISVAPNTLAFTFVVLTLSESFLSFIVNSTLFCFLCSKTISFIKVSTLHPSIFFCKSMWSGQETVEGKLLINLTGSTLTKKDKYPLKCTTYPVGRVNLGLDFPWSWTFLNAPRSWAGPYSPPWTPITRPDQISPWTDSQTNRTESITFLVCRTWLSNMVQKFKSFKIISNWIRKKNITPHMPQFLVTENHWYFTGKNCQLPLFFCCFYYHISHIFADFQLLYYTIRK